MASSTLVIKSVLGEDLRRFRVDSNISFSDFVDTIHQLYKTSSDLIIKYTDDEGDLITISSNEELKEAFRFAQTQTPPILRLSCNSSSSVNLLFSNLSITSPPQPVSTPSSSIPSIQKEEPKVLKTEPYVKVLSEALPGSSVGKGNPPVPSQAKNTPIELSPISYEEWKNNYYKVFSETAKKAEELGQQVAQSSSELCKNFSEHIDNLANQTAQMTNTYSTEYAKKVESFNDNVRSAHQEAQNSLDDFLGKLSQIAATTFQKTNELSQQIAKNSLKLAEQTAEHQQQ